MSYIFSLLILSVVAAAYSAPVTNIKINDPCNADIDRYSPCTATVSAPTGCSSTIVNFTGTVSATCDGINFFWSQGNNNITFVIETSYTKARQAYTVSLANSPLIQDGARAYRIINNQETDVTTSDSRIVQVSDSNYQVILKFQGPVRSIRGGVIINYDVSPKI